MAHATRTSSRLFGFALIAIATVVGCETAPESTDCLKAPQKLYPSMGLHNATCKQGADCQYGVCSFNSMQGAGVAGVGVCTKDCSCGSKSSACDVDNAQGLEFVCIRNDYLSPLKRSECAVRCKSDSDCANPQTPHCVDSVPGSFSGAAKVCAAKKP